VVNSFHRKGMKLPAIVAELAAVDHEDAFDENRMKYCDMRSKDIVLI
jgi:hypothetical protein